MYGRTERQSSSSHEHILTLSLGNEFLSEFYISMTNYSTHCVAARSRYVDSVEYRIAISFANGGKSQIERFMEFKD